MVSSHISSVPFCIDIQCRYRYLKIMESQNAAWTLAEDIALLEEVTKQPEGAKDWQKVLFVFEFAFLCAFYRFEILSVFD